MANKQNDDIKKASKELEDLKQDYQFKLNAFNSIYQQKIKALEEAQGQQILDVDILYNSKTAEFKRKYESFDLIINDIDDYIEGIEEHLNELEKMTKGDR